MSVRSHRCVWRMLGFIGGSSAALSAVFADSHVTNVPSLSSDPGAPYTVYLDFSGFNFTGTWGGNTTDGVPGNVPAFNGMTDGAFSASDVSTIKSFWARVANSYSSFNVNVTTIDPALALSTDAQRQAYYDSTARVTHTVITTASAGLGGGGGVSFVGVAPNSYGTSANGGAGAGYHTDWVFTNGVGTGVAGGQAAAHEEGHAFGLSHQSDYQTSSGSASEYSVGDNNNGPGTYAPVMGAAYYTQRGAWRLGTLDNGSIQNDAKVIVGDSGMGTYRNSNAGHNLANATPLPTSLTGSVNPTLAKGIINPVNIPNPTPIGANNYTSDYWTFTSDGTNATLLTVLDGNNLLTASSQDPGAMLRSTLSILDSTGALYAMGIEAASTLTESFIGVLPAGTYYAKVSSFGGETQTLANGTNGNFDTTYYYDMGSYFITGAVAVPEPMLAGLIALASGTMLMSRSRRRVE